jgi:phosphoribosylformylglycinamidine cyclo-ligase
MPDGLGARIDRTSWRVPALFRLIQETGGIDDEEMYKTFNMGLGIVLAVTPADAGQVLDALPEAWACGTVIDGEGVSWR